LALGERVGEAAEIALHQRSHIGVGADGAETVVFADLGATSAARQMGMPGSRSARMSPARRSWARR
jgi:hypothetical protein